MLASFPDSCGCVIPPFSCGWRASHPGKECRLKWQYFPLCPEIKQSTCSVYNSVFLDADIIEHGGVLLMDWCCLWHLLVCAGLKIRLRWINISVWVNTCIPSAYSCILLHTLAYSCILLHTLAYSCIPSAYFPRCCWSGVTLIVREGASESGWTWQTATNFSQSTSNKISSGPGECCRVSNRELWPGQQRWVALSVANSGLIYIKPDVISTNSSTNWACSFWVCSISILFSIMNCCWG